MPTPQKSAETVLVSSSFVPLRYSRRAGYSADGGRGRPPRGFRRHRVAAPPRSFPRGYAAETRRRRGRDDAELLSTPPPQVLQHFGTYVAGADGVEFVGDAEYLGSERRNGGMVASFADGREISAREVVVAAGFDYTKHADPNYNGITDDSTPEIQARDVPASMQTAGPARCYVVVGGGKTGLDACGFLAKHKRDQDDVYLIAGSKKCFMNRDLLYRRPSGKERRESDAADATERLCRYPPKAETGIFVKMFTEYFIDWILAWDGTAESERRILREQTAKGVLSRAPRGDATPGRGGRRGREV